MNIASHISCTNAQHHAFISLDPHMSPDFHEIYSDHINCLQSLKLLKSHSLTLITIWYAIYAYFASLVAILTFFTRDYVMQSGVAFVLAIETPDDVEVIHFAFAMWKEVSESAAIFRSERYTCSTV